MALQQLTRSIALILLLQIKFASAYWRLACSVSQEARLDPILFPGQVSPHVHKFAGGINVGASSTGQTLQQSSCSTCQVQKDTSAYWTPSLYYQHPDGTFESVPNDGMTVYYVGRGGNPSNTKPFPPGFSMVSGNSLLRHYDTTALTYEDVRPIADRTHYIDQTNCVNGLRAQLNFQSCWDGKNLYLENSAHVAYLSGIDYGNCPPTHPVPIPGLFFEVLYWVNDINQRPGGRFVFSNGDPTGYGFHGDFINGWDQDVLDSAVENCLYTDNGGVVNACSALVPSNDVNFARICPQAANPFSEQVYGNLTSLPGCNPVTTNDTTPPVCPSKSTPISSMTATGTLTRTISSTTSHSSLLNTASIPLVITTLTSFITVTAPAESTTKSSSVSTSSPPALASSIKSNPSPTSNSSSTSTLSPTSTSSPTSVFSSTSISPLTSIGSSTLHSLTSTTSSTSSSELLTVIRTTLTFSVIGRPASISFPTGTSSLSSPGSYGFPTDKSAYRPAPFPPSPTRRRRLRANTHNDTN